MTITERRAAAVSRLTHVAGGVRKKANAALAAVRPEPTPDDSGGRTVVEQVDVGVSPEVAHEEWATWPHFPAYLDLGRSLVLDDTAGQRFVWRTRTGRGHVDGAVAFHRLAPELTRVVMVVEAHPRGPIERLRSRRRMHGLHEELLAFQQRVMSDSVLHGAAVKPHKKKGKKKKG